MIYLEEKVSREFTHIGLSNDGTMYSGLLPEPENYWVTMTPAEIAHHAKVILKLQPGEILPVSRAIGTASLIALASLAGLAIIILVPKRGKR